MPAAAAVMDTVPKTSAVVSVIATEFTPVLVRDTAPPKSFAACVRVIAKFPVLKLAVPAAMELFMPPAPCVIAPPAVIAIFRSVDMVSVGTSYAALV